MLMIGALFTAVTATSQATGTHYHLAGLIFAAPISPVEFLQTAGATSFFWIRTSLLPHHTRLRTLFPIRSTFRRLISELLPQTRTRRSIAPHFTIRTFNFS